MAQGFGFGGKDHSYHHSYHHRREKARMKVGELPASPAAVEAARLAKAERAMKKFCLDLSSLVGRVVGPQTDEDVDPVTADIYTAAVEAGIDINAFMHAEGDEVQRVLEGEVPWFSRCCHVLEKLRQRIPSSSYHRVLDIWTGNEDETSRDPDVALCLEYANSFFDTSKKDPDAVVDLATCLLDYAFTRQGIDEGHARVTRDASELTKALEKARAPVPAPRCLNVGDTVHIGDDNYGVVVGRVSEVSLVRDQFGNRWKSAPKTRRARNMPEYRLREGYELRETKLEDGNVMLEAHLDAWEEGLWQEVGSEGEAKLLAQRTNAELERGKALMQVVEEKTTELTETVEETHDPGLQRQLELYELISQANLGKSIGVLATVLGGIALLLTKAVVVIPMVMVAWVAAYVLTDRRAIKARKDRLALKAEDSERS